MSYFTDLGKSGRTIAARGTTVPIRRAAAEESARGQEAEARAAVAETALLSTKKKITIGVVLGLAAVGGGWWFLKKRKKAP